MGQIKEIKRCAIYIRVSTAMQRMEGWSLDAQRASLTEYAAKRGWKVVGIYADEGKSARKRLKDRREIFRLLEDVKAREIDVILFKELDRWFRNVADFYKVQEVLDDAGVVWVSERQPTLDMTTKEGRLNVNVLISVGQNEADSTSDRIKYTNRYMRQQRRWTSGPSTLPRGYTLDENQHVIKDPEQELFVQTLIDNFMMAGSIRKALLQTNDEFPDQAMLYNNTLRLLRNPLLCGEYREIEDFVAEPYMTRADFDRMQGMMRRNVRHSIQYEYIFAGLLYCAGCGSRLAGSPTVNRAGKIYKYYKCGHKATNGLCASKGRTGEQTLEKQLLDLVQDAVADRIATVTAVRQAAAATKKKPRKSNRASIEKQLDRLEDLYISSDRMTKERYEEKRAAILAKLVEDEPEPELPELADLEKIQKLLNSGALELYKNFTEAERRTFWRRIIKKITMRGKEIQSVEFIE